MTRLVQIQNSDARRVALVDEPNLRLVTGVESIYELINLTRLTGKSLFKLIQDGATGEKLDYSSIYMGKSSWRLLPPIDNPSEPGRCLVSGTGLTHLGSAKNRQAMHSTSEVDLNDSIKMFKWGVRSTRWFRPHVHCLPTRENSHCQKKFGWR